MSALWTVFFSWLPAWMQVVILGLISLVIIFVVIKVVGLVLDAIPFL